MRLANGFQVFDEDHERENIAFHDRPRKTLEGLPLELTEKVYNSNPELVDHIATTHGMTVKLVPLEEYGRDVTETDTFLVLEVVEGQLKPWFGYWDPTGCKFLREKGTEFPYCWVTPTMVDPQGNVLSQGDPKIKMTVETLSPEEMEQKIKEIKGE